MSDLTPEISGKQLEILKEIIPRLSNLAVIGDASVPANAQLLSQLKLAAEAMSIQVKYLEVRT